MALPKHMNKNRIFVASLVSAVVLLLGMVLAGRWAVSVGNNLEQLSVDVSQLSDRLDTAESRANAAESRAAEAESRAAEAQVQASGARREAETAQADTAEARSEATAARRDAALADAKKNAAELARVASIAAQHEAEREKAEALAREASALQQVTQAYEAATKAQQATAIARAETAQLRKEREAELSRLADALGELAETRRTALGLVMNLGDGVEFDTDRAELRPQNRELLARIAGVLLTAGDYSIQVFGHTDDVGDDEYNLTLSERRAQSVVDYLIESGVPGRVVIAKGLGKSQPLVEATDEEARQRNRRVEIAVISYNEEYVPPEPP